MNGLALALGAILAGIRQVIRELDDADGQRLVLIHEIRNERRHDTVDPRIDPPPYWPSKPSPTRRKRPYSVGPVEAFVDLGGGLVESGGLSGCGERSGDLPHLRRPAPALRFCRPAR